MSGTILAADLFCGAGGTSTGLLLAARNLGKNINLLAVNHWQIAVDTHAANHQDARHLTTGLESIVPAEVVPGGRLDLLWASPSCTHHSIARGGRPCNDQSRAQPLLVLDWLANLDVKRVLIENVPEFVNWGPLGCDGKPLRSKRGALFDAFLHFLGELGYRYEWRILCCADYGDPTTRSRFFLQAVKGRGRIVWPEPGHARDPGNLFGNIKPWVPAREIIDWTIPGKSIFRRKKPLAENTLRRIEAGIRKYWGEWAEPFLVVLRGTKSPERTAQSIGKPLPAITAGGGHVALVEPFIAAIGQTSGGKRTRSLNEPVPALVTKSEQCVVEPFIVPQHSCGANRDTGQPIPTITNGGAHALIEPFLVPNFGERDGQVPRTHDLSSPLPAVTGHGAGALVEPFLVTFYGQGEAVSVDRPFATITTKDRFGVIQQYGLDILFRMLQPHELARAHSFPGDYIFTGNKSEIVKQIGNSVPVKTAQALCEAALSA